MEVSDSSTIVELLTHWAVVFMSLTIMIPWGKCDFWVMAYSTNDVIGISSHTGDNCSHSLNNG